MKIEKRSVEDEAKFKCFGKTQGHENCMNEEIKSRLNSGNACCRLVERLLSLRLLSRNVKINKTIIVPVVFMGVKRGLSH
jgi:hypothetical protein